MKLSKRSVIFIIINFIIILGSVIPAFFRTCPPPFSVRMGPGCITHMGLSFNSTIRETLIIPLTLSIFVGVVAAAISYTIIKKTKEHSIQVLINFFSIAFIILTILGVFITSQTVY